MSRIVMKFGGTSVADTKKIENAADKVLKEVENGHEVAVVVSAMSGVTNKLVGYCSEITPIYDAREYDAVVASGEQVTAGLMAIALQKRGIAARSWLGWQIPVICNDIHGKARIEEIKADEIKQRFADNEVAVVAGFQGVTHKNRITTLGRGGSDTSAVAFSAAIDADRCDIYTDVNGIYTTDPRIVPKAKKLKNVSYEEMLEMASAGAKVLQSRSVEMAMKNNVLVQVLSSFEDEIGSELPGTILMKECDIVEKYVVNGITYSKDEAKITILNVPDKPGVASEIFSSLADATINVDMIIQNISPDGSSTDMTFTVPSSDLNRAIDSLKKNSDINDDNLVFTDNITKISVVGIGMRSHTGVAEIMFKSLADKSINIQAISTSEIKISVLIDQAYTELAVRSLHTAYNLDQE